MDLTVVIPARNAARTIGEMLDSLEPQQWGGAWEVVVVDNGSSDGTRRVVEAYLGRLPSLRMQRGAEWCVRSISERGTRKVFRH